MYQDQSPSPSTRSSVDKTAPHASISPSSDNNVDLSKSSMPSRAASNQIQQKDVALKELFKSDPVAAQSYVSWHRMSPKAGWVLAGCSALEMLCSQPTLFNIGLGTLAIGLSVGYAISRKNHAETEIRENVPEQYR